MDFDEYWQENKRFVGIVFTGLMVFLIARMGISSTVGAEAKDASTNEAAAVKKLRDAMYSTADRDKARKENEALVTVAGKLKQSVAFEPREGFTIAGAISPSSRYHAALADVREEIMPMAGRSNMVVDADLGQPDLSPTREEEIVRHLEALDLIDRVLHLAVDVRLGRVDKIHVVLDPSLKSKGGVGAIEKTRVDFEFSGSGAAVLEFLRRSQEPELVIGGRALTILSLDTRAAKRQGEIQTKLSLAVVRLHEVETSDGEEL
ncbi:MAG: hypothetical protein ACI9C2_000017 [Gammaproteobacteria bacterium]|jgi:hypothetical protein